MTTQEEYLSLKAASGKRKLKAGSLLAYGDPESRFEAAVLYHEAAHLEERAFALLQDPAPETRLRAAVERCGCLVRGLDVVWATRVWREVEALSATVPPEIASAHRDRIDPLYEMFRRDLTALWGRVPILAAAQFRWENIPPSDKARARAELDALLERFPGEAEFHLIASRAAVDEGRLDDALRAIRHAYRLQPGNSLSRALMFLVVADSLTHPDGAMSRTEAGDHLARTHEELQREPADAVVYLGFMMASLAAFLVTSSRGDDTEIHRQRALWAADVGATRPSTVAKDIHEHIKTVRPLVELLTENLDAWYAIAEPIRDLLSSGGIKRPSQEPTPPPTPASLIREVTFAALRRTPQPALTLAA